MKNLLIYLMYWFGFGMVGSYSYDHNHSKTEPLKNLNKMAAILLITECHWKAEHHWKTEQRTTIGKLIVFRISSPHCT